MPNSVKNVASGYAGSLPIQMTFHLYSMPSGPVNTRLVDLQRGIIETRQWPGVEVNDIQCIALLQEFFDSPSLVSNFHAADTFSEWSEKIEDDTHLLFSSAFPLPAAHSTLAISAPLSIYPPTLIVSRFPESEVEYKHERSAESLLVNCICLQGKKSFQSATQDKTYCCSSRPANKRSFPPPQALHIMVRDMIAPLGGAVVFRAITVLSRADNHGVIRREGHNMSIGIGRNV